MKITLHYEPNIEWQQRRVEQFRAGLAALDIPVMLTTSSTRINADPCVLFGTTFFTAIEAAPGDWMLVDRCSFGDGDEAVSLVWNGHGRRGDHKVPNDWDGSRWERYRMPCIGGIVQDPGAKRIVLCGQEQSYSPDWPTLPVWYANWSSATHFRPHPTAGNPTGKPEYTGWDVSLAITLNSSVAIQYLLRGVPVVVDDAGGMAFDWDRHGSLLKFFEWLAWTQWTWDEIETGTPIAHLFH